MNSKWISISALLVFAGLGGCASMSSEECANSDWRAIGYEDGSNGYSTDRFGGRRKACAKHGVTADFQAYQSGRREGLVEFCQPSRGFNLGQSGRHYNGVCDTALEEEFLDAYRVGHQLYSLRSNVNNANSQIYSREREIERAKSVMREKEVALISDETETQQRLILLADLKDLSERRGQLESEIEGLIADRARHEYELRAYEVTIAEYGY